MFTNESPIVCLLLIGWHEDRALSVTECKQDSDWLLASPHWAVREGKKAITGPAVSRRPRLDDERGDKKERF